MQDYTACFDFSLAGTVVLGALPYLREHERLQLVGWSASAYFAQVLLGKLLGRRPTFGDAVTGAIGEQVRDLATRDLLMDHYLDRVEHVSPKLRYVFDAECADVVVVPKDNEYEADSLLAQAARHGLASGSSEGDLRRQSSQVFAVETLSSVADIVQHEGWRRAQYVRCPEVGLAAGDLATAIRRKPDFTPRAGIRAALHMLEGSTHAVVDIASFGPETIGQALVYVDSFLREHEVGNTGDVVRLEVVAPSLSWAFVRLADEGEEDTDFWHVVWRVIGAPMETFYRFCLSPTASIAAEQVIDALNRFLPSADHPSHRAPDILVLLGVKNARDKFAAWTGKAARPLAPAAVIAEIQRRHEDLVVSSSRHSCERLHRSLGRARVLLVGTDDHGASNADARTPNLQDLTEETVDRLRAVSVFRWGFTHHAAAAVLAGLNVVGADAKAVLSELVGQRVLRRFDGQYFLPRRLHRQLTAEGRGDGAAGTARRHLAAARALAPYVKGGSAAGLPLERALLPANVVEARWHFVQAGDAIARASVDTFRLIEARDIDRTRSALDGWRGLAQEVSNARQSLERASLWPGPGLIYDLLGRGTPDALEAAYQTAQQHMDGVLKHPLNKEAIPPHPMMLLSAARAAAGRVDLWNDKIDMRRREDHMLSAANAFERALAGCDGYPASLMTNAEQLWTRIHVLCHYAEFLHDQERNPIRRALGDRNTSIIDVEVWNATSAWAGESGRAAVTPQWLERQADEQQAAAEAAELYMLGDRLYPNWHQFGFKGLGALSLDGGRRGDIVMWLESRADRVQACAQLAWRCAGEGRRTEKWSDSRRTRVKGYWKAAVKEVQDAWCDDSKVDAALWRAFLHQHLVPEAWGIAPLPLGRLGSPAAATPLC